MPPPVRLLWPRLRRGAAVSAILLAGCTKGFHPVKGQVVWSDGKPATELASGSVGFSSEELKISARGSIQPDATFSLSSLKKDDGLPAGTYQVMVFPPELFAMETDPTGKVSVTPQGPNKLLPAKYHSYRTSGLSVTVESKTNEVTITVDKAPK